MKPQTVIALLHALLATSPLVAAATPPPLTAAVLDFKESGDELAGTGASISALLQLKLGSDSDSPLVERAELKEILREQELNLTGSVSAAQAVRLGELTGAEVLISGRVFGIENRVYIVAKIISSSTGRVFGASAEYERYGQIDIAVSSLSTQLAKILKEKRPELAGGKSLEERQLDTIKATMKDRKAPTIYLSIKEVILNKPAPDPAAQTELGRILQAAGWTVVASQKEADVAITGEAFAETGVRRGNLWFVRARLEFTIQSAAGKVLTSDRIVAGNVDIAEAISNKGALQKAGLLAAAEVAKVWAAAKSIR